MLPSTEQSRSDCTTTTRNRRYQIAGLLCFVIILTVACVGTLASSYIQHALGIEGNDEHKHESKSSESSSTSTTNLDIITTTLSPTTTFVIPTNITSRMMLPPSHLPSLQPSLQPTVTDSNHPSLNPTVPLPSYSMVPSIVPSMFPSSSMEPSTHVPDIFGIYVMGDVVSNLYYLLYIIAL